MIFTSNHNLFVPELEDEILESIVKYGENFEKIDELIYHKAPNLETALDIGKLYENGHIIYNSSLGVGDYVGWVNIREGRHADQWEKEKYYNLGEIVKSTDENGYYYRCVIEGLSSPIEPSFPTSVEGVIDDTHGILSWTPSTNYKVGNICKRTDGNTMYYFKCIIAGTSGLSEPTWNNIHNSTISDNGVTWRVCKKATWKNEGSACIFRPFGKIE